MISLMKIGLAQTKPFTTLKETKGVLTSIKGEWRQEGLLLHKIYRNGQKYRTSLISSSTPLKTNCWIKISKHEKTNEVLCLYLNENLEKSLMFEYARLLVWCKNYHITEVKNITIGFCWLWSMHRFSGKKLLFNYGKVPKELGKRGLHGSRKGINLF